MERTYVLTPEMLGLNWSRLFRQALGRGVIYLLAAMIFSALSNGHWMSSVSAALVGSAIDFGLTFTVRYYAPTRLRVTNDTIEEVDGPIIHKNEVVAVNECNDSEPFGLEIIGRRKTSWLPNYRIFIPATIADFNDLRQLVHCWDEAEGQSRSSKSGSYW